MGYALLYESMLDSVLVARDRFLRRKTNGNGNGNGNGEADEDACGLARESSDEKGDFAGVMAPSQTQMVLGLCDGAEVYKERVSFWGDVYGFDMSAMAEDLYEDAIVDVVSPESLVCEGVVIKVRFRSPLALERADILYDRTSPSSPPAPPTSPSPRPSPSPSLPSDAQPSAPSSSTSTPSSTRPPSLSRPTRKCTWS